MAQDPAELWNRDHLQAAALLRTFLQQQQQPNALISNTCSAIQCEAAPPAPAAPPAEPAAKSKRAAGVEAKIKGIVAGVLELSPAHGSAALPLHVSALALQAQKQMLQQLLRMARLLRPSQRLHPARTGSRGPPSPAQVQLQPQGAPGLFARQWAMSGCCDSACWPQDGGRCQAAGCVEQGQAEQGQGPEGRQSHDVSATAQVIPAPEHQALCREKRPSLLSSLLPAYSLQTAAARRMRPCSAGQARAVRARCRCWTTATRRMSWKSTCLLAPSVQPARCVHLGRQAQPSCHLAAFDFWPLDISLIACQASAACLTPA